MSKWGSQLYSAREKGNVGKIETPRDRFARGLAATRAKEKARLEDEKRGTIYESKIKRRGK